MWTKERAEANRRVYAAVDAKRRPELEDLVLCSVRARALVRERWAELTPEVYAARDGTKLNPPQE